MSLLTSRRFGILRPAVQKAARALWLNPSICSASGCRATQVSRVKAACSSEVTGQKNKPCLLVTCAALWALLNIELVCKECVIFLNH